MEKDDPVRVLDNLAELFNEAEPDDIAEAREELRAVGLDPVLVRARLRDKIEGLLAGLEKQDAPGDSDLSSKDAGRAQSLLQPVPVPWALRVDGQWQVDLAVASNRKDENNWLNLDLSNQGFIGDLRVGLFISGESDRGHSLVVEWEAGFYRADGWVLALYHCDENEPFFRRNIGRGYRGSVVLTSEILGTDPASTPLKFLFMPDVEKSHLE